MWEDIFVHHIFFSDFSERIQQTVETDEFQPVSVSLSSWDSCWIENHSDCVSSSRVDHGGEHRLKSDLEKCKCGLNLIHDN